MGQLGSGDNVRFPPPLCFPVTGSSFLDTSHENVTSKLKPNEDQRKLASY